MLFSDVLDRCSTEKKTGLLNVSVVQSNKFLVRIYFKEGMICRLSYGPLCGKECLDLLEYYDFSQAVYFDGVRAPDKTVSSLSTEDIISALRETGKAIHISQWFEKGVFRPWRLLNKKRPPLFRPAIGIFRTGSTANSSMT